MIELSYQTVFLLITVWTATGFIIGKYRERSHWNNLIDTGIIPAPKKY